jgi:hypothetical protein
MNATDNPLDVHVRRLEALLKKERALLLAGEARQAVALNPEKLVLLEALEPLAAGIQKSTALPSNLTALKRLAQENASMLSASLNGLRTALARLGRLEHDASVGAYGQSGLHLPFDSLSGTYQRKF